MEKGENAFLGGVDILLDSILDAEPLELGGNEFVACLN